MNFAEDYVVVKRLPEDAAAHVDGGGLVRCPDDALLAVVPFVPTGPSYPNEVHLCRSEDGGETWAECCQPRNWYTATPFCHDGAVYLIGFLPGTEYRNKDILLARSDDGGRTWTEPVTLFEGPYWATSTGMTRKDGQLYYAVDRLDIEGRGISVIAGDLSTDLLSSENWRISDPVPYPGTPDKIVRGMYPPEMSQVRRDSWLESNVINVNGSLRVLTRCDIDGKATSALAGVSDLHDDGTTLELSFTQFHPMPGAQCKFAIIHDDVSGYFWSALNIPTDSQNFHGRLDQWLKRGFHGAGGNERRFLILQYSLDGLNWFQAGYVAAWDSPLQGFQYASPLIGGDDLLLVVRTSKEGPNQHDADMMTFHRVSDFRSHALDLWGEG